MLLVFNEYFIVFDFIKDEIIADVFKLKKKYINL